MTAFNAATPRPRQGTASGTNNEGDSMSIITQGAQSPFDQIRHRDESGDYWTGRELQPLMGYAKWENFAKVVRRAEASAANTGQGGFSPIRENLSTKPREDFRLTRFAAYLVAMNGDPNMPQVAAAQAYFAVRTRQAETATPTPALQGPELIAAALVEADRTLRAREARIEAQAATIAVLEPKAGAWDLWLSTNADYSIKQVAAALHHAGVETIDLGDGKPHVMGQNNLLRWLRLREWVAKKSTVPNKTAIDTHRMTVRLGTYIDSKTGESHGTSTPRITAKGAVDLAHRFDVLAETVAEYLTSDDEAVA